MRVLGIQEGITCGAAIVEDGRIVAAINEERLSRLKMAFGFPRESIPEVCRLAGIELADIDLVTVATWNNYFYNGLRPFDGWLVRDKGTLRTAIFLTAGRLSPFISQLPWLESLYYKARTPIYRRRRGAIEGILRDEFGLDGPVRFVNHHYAHATSTYFTSGFTDAMVVSMDGGGDRMSSHIYDVRDGQFREITRTSSFNSVANYYAYVTNLCGFKAQKHEGKITGLAAYGEPRYVELLDQFITFESGALQNVGRVMFFGALDALHKALPAGWTREDLAASIQQHAEDLAVRYITHHLSAGRPRKLALAGGLFANVRINQKVAEIPGVEEIFVHPGMTDAGLAVGAALTPCARTARGAEMSHERAVLRHVYFGPGYTDREIEAALKSDELKYSKPDRIEAEVGRLLAEGYVVARFDGRMEYGPRALGNRSILYHPADRSVNDWLNAHLHRTEFMPFAPSTLIEHADEFYKNIGVGRDAARFMTVTFDCTDWMKQTCEGVVHIDGTARPQLVCREDSPSYYAIIEEFGRLTGIPTIINTSFNMHEEPIVCTPQDAIRAFRLGHLDYLAIGDYLVPSPEPVTHPLRPMQAVKAAI